MSMLVSVVIPTYNHAHFMGRALQSLLDQTYSNWEALVIDNNSQDNTAQIVQGFADSRIHLLKIHNHGVIAASRNLGIKEARGELLAFLDSDDFWYPTKLERCMALLEQGYDLVCHGERWLGDGRDRDVFYGPESRARYQSLLYEGNCLSTSAVVVYRDHVLAVGGFSENEEIVTAEDYDLWLLLARHGIRMGFVREILGEYTIHPGGQSRAILKNMQATMHVVRKHFSLATANSLNRRLKARRREGIIYYGCARGLQDSAQFNKAWTYFFSALRAWPFLPKLYIAMFLNFLHRRVV